MQAIVDRLERLIQRHPEQWYMFRPMWPADPEAGSDGDAARRGRGRMSGRPASWIDRAAPGR